MKIILIIIIASFGLFSCSCQRDETMKDPVEETNPVPVTKTNTTKVFMHYMPWFHTKSFSGYWGSHWRMSNKNPEVILPNGQREIASHYYPLIGPYDSSDPDVVDYHMLLMKYSGIDGILIDWYGSHNILDYGSNLKNANAAIAGAERAGLGFAIVYEDNTADEVARRKNITAIDAAKQDMSYLKQNYLSKENYIKINQQPLLMTFGPRFFITPTQWTTILEPLNTKMSFFPLWHHKHRTGTTNTTGEFSWVDFTSSLEDLDDFYTKNNVESIIGSAYPGFHDFYKEGGWGDGYGFVDHQQEETMGRTLEKSATYQLPFLQLVTWNDFGEGTMIEPTVEFQFRYIEMLQEYTGVSYDKSAFEIIHTYYQKRKEFDTDLSKNEILDEVFIALIRLNTAKAEELILNL